MNKIFNRILLAGVVTLSLSSCNDFLTIEPEDTLVQDNFYDSPKMLRNQTSTLYDGYTWKDYHFNFNWKMDMLNGDMFYTYSYEGQWFFGTYTSVNAYLYEGWKGLYNVISFCNSVINDTAEHCTGSITQADIDAAIAEARCIRAFCYYQIAEVWRDAPIIFNNSKNIADGNLDVPRNTQKSIYQFALEDADYAVENLPESDPETYRATKKTAKAVRAKILLTMAAHKDYGYDRADLYARAAKDCDDVINSSEWIGNIPFETLFDVSANNGPESILAIQCGVLGYGYGNPRTIAWGRGSVVADGAWGAGKGPTISLQKSYDPTDLRRKWTYMTQGDYYPNINKANGGYHYDLVNEDQQEERNEMNAHLKKYILGKSADVDGMVGTNQDAGNNVYLIRLADIYLMYAEAVMGTAQSTTDALALTRFNDVRKRAGVALYNSLTYKDLLMEYRRELAFESHTWFDTLRLRYREGDEEALNWINTGCETGYNRAAQYVALPGTDKSNQNNPDQYTIARDKSEGAMYDPIIISAQAFSIPLPAEVTTSSPALNGPAVDFYGN